MSNNAIPFCNVKAGGFLPLAHPCKTLRLCNIPSVEIATVGMMMLSDPRASTSQLQTLICVRLDQQKKAAQNHIAELDKDKTFSEPIATEVVPLKHFYPRGRLSSRLFASEVSVHRLQRLAQGAKLQDEYPSLYNQYNQ